jgi:hypothetical protein
LDAELSGRRLSAQRTFARCLTPAGALRDVRERATWLRRFAEEIDRDTGR